MYSIGSSFMIPYPYWWWKIINTGNSGTNSHQTVQKKYSPQSSRHWEPHIHLYMKPTVSISFLIIEDMSWILLPVRKGEFCCSYSWMPLQNLFLFCWLINVYLLCCLLRMLMFCHRGSKIWGNSLLIKIEFEVQGKQ